MSRYPNRVVSFITGERPHRTKLPVRVIARAWNACVEEVKEWPRQRLIEPPVKPLSETAWESFPQGLREEIERYLAGFKKIRRGVSGKRVRPCKKSTINTPPAGIASLCPHGGSAGASQRNPDRARGTS